jgi:hypothetical protein
MGQGQHGACGVQRSPIQTFYRWRKKYGGVPQRYRSTQRADEDRLTQAIVTLATRCGRYGYRRITVLLWDAGWHAGKDCVQRIWRREGLKVPTEQQLRGRLLLNGGSCIRLRSERENHVWSYDSRGPAAEQLPGN